MLLTAPRKRSTRFALIAATFERRSLVITAFMPVKRNEIDFASNRLQQFGEASGILFGVINAIDQNIFESNSAARRQRVLPTGFQQLFQWIFAINRH